MNASPSPLRIRVAAGGNYVLAVEAGSLIVAESATVLIDAGTRWLDGVGLPCRHCVETGTAFEVRDGGWLRVEAGSQGADIVVVARSSRVTAIESSLQQMRGWLVRTLRAVVRQAWSTR